MRKLVALGAVVFLALPAAACPRHVRVTVHAWFDLPRDDERSHGLSGLVWDAGKLYAVSDRRPAILTLVPDERFTRFGFGDSLAVDLGTRWDVEAIAVAGDRFYLGNEDGPSVHVVDRAGKPAGELPLPASFLGARHNHGLESLTASPDGTVLFAANEHAFVGDGGLGDFRRGTTVRLTRIDLATRDAVQHTYLTDPVYSSAIDGRVGVSEMAALSSTELLVVERAYVPSAGNGVRVYCVDLPEAPADGNLAKTLVVDVARLSAKGVPRPSQPQRNRLLDNFEGLALGPTLPDGRRLFFMVSDDNSSERQVARVLVLAASGL